MIRTHGKAPLRRRKSSAIHNDFVAKWTSVLNLLTILLICFSLIVISLLTMNIWWGPNTQTADCDIIVLTLVTTFHLSKGTFYAILITRLQVAFGSSHLRYSRTTIWCLFAFVGLYTALIVVGSPMIVYGQNVRTPLSNWCHVHIIEDGGLLSQMAVLLWIVMDMAISMTLLFLFQRPITHLLKT